MTTRYRRYLFEASSCPRPGAFHHTVGKVRSEAQCTWYLANREARRVVSGMASLDDLLLEAAGRTKGSSEKTSQTKQRRPPIHDSSSDDHSDSNNEDDDYDRKGKGSRMPVKKRFEPADKDEEGGYESELSFGSDLYKDEKDRAALQAMTELDREMILAERAEQRDNYLLRKGGKRHVDTPSKVRDKDQGPPSSRMRSSVRESTRTSKENALSELVARRQRAQDTDLQKKRRDSAPGPSHRDRPPPSDRRPSYSSSDDLSEEDDSDRAEEEASVGDEEDGGMAEEPEADVDDIRSITIPRRRLLKWFMEPFFEETIVGCFVRIGIGVSSTGSSIYRCCFVKNVDAKDPDKAYKFENRMTYKYLNLVWGDEQAAARWQMIRVSDQPPSDGEIKEALREWKKFGGRPFTKMDIQEKRATLAKVSTHVYTSDDVKKMLQEKKLSSNRPTNVALEKDRIMKELELAQDKPDKDKDQAGIERLQNRLKELEQLSSQVKSKDAKALALAEMNRRNRFENFKNASETKPTNVDAKAGEVGYDPFSRRWTRSQNYYQKSVPKEAKAENEGAAVADKAVENGAQAVVAQKLVRRQVPVDGRTQLFALHDFDLQISLAGIHQYSGGQGAHHAFMARRRKLEAVYGCPVESNDGRRHTLTLTVNDYKRRRGLL